MTAYSSQTLVSEKITLNRNGGNQPSTAVCMIMWTSLSLENEVDILLGPGFTGKRAVLMEGLLCVR